MQKLSCLFFIFFTTFSTSFAFPCNRYTTPNTVKILKDYNIIASHIAIIPTELAFSGHQSMYAIVAHPKNKTNIIKINAHTGKVRIDANAEDQFDVKVIAKNHCGTATTKFNVQINAES